jgi:5-methylcytosine-specific restriction endonuclease McrA
LSNITTSGRSVPEWVGTTPDAKIPPHVRLRIFERFEGICQLTRRKIRAGDAWAIDHVIPLADGGSHRESNLVPVLEIAHRQKTGAENTARAKVRAVKAKHIGGIRETRNPLPGSRNTRWKKKISGEVVER